MAGLENSSIPDLNLNVTSNDNYQVNIFRICVLYFNVLFGPPVHAYVLWHIVKGRGIASEFLCFQFSVSEIIICMNSLLMLLSFRFTEISGSLSFAMGLIITGRPLFQCLISVERYLAVVHPVTFLKYKPLRYKLFCSAASWFMALSSCFFCMFTADTYSRVYRFGILLQFLLFFSVNLFCCVAVLRALKQSGPGERGREREEENHMKRRAFNLILIITVNMVVMYAPVILLALFYLLLSDFSQDFLCPLAFYVSLQLVSCSLFCISAGLENCPSLSELKQCKLNHYLSR